MHGSPGAERILQALADEPLRQLARAAALTGVRVRHHRGRQGRRRGQAQVARPDGPTGCACGERAVDVSAEGRIAVQEAGLHKARGAARIGPAFSLMSVGTGAALIHTGGWRPHRPCKMRSCHMHETSI